MSSCEACGESLAAEPIFGRMHVRCIERLLTTARTVTVGYLADPCSSASAPGDWRRFSAHDPHTSRARPCLCQGTGSGR